MTNCVRRHAYLLLCLFAIPFFRLFVVESLGKPYDIRVSGVLTPEFLGEPNHPYKHRNEIERCLFAIETLSEG